jgi:hypothetical protein
MMMIYKELSSQQDKDRFVVLLLSFIVIIFWGAFEQAGGLMIYIRMLKQTGCYWVGKFLRLCFRV